MKWWQTAVFLAVTALAISITREQDASISLIIILLLAGAVFYWYIGVFSAVDDPNAEIERARQSATRRLRGKTYPPPFANGWYKVCTSEDLPKGKMMEIEMLGLSLCVFRGENGVPCVMDAYCPHMGANLCKGGRVVGNCVECPFHRFQFDTDGKCTHIPYQENIPPQANNHKWPTFEYNHMVCMFYDCDHKQPAYFPPAVPEVAAGSMTYRGQYSSYVAMHLQEFAENSADFQHFQPLHGQMQIPFTEIPIPNIYIEHEAGWEPGEGEESWRAVFSDHAYLKWGNTRIKNTDADATITFVGPGGIVYFRFITPIGQMVLFMTHTPIEPLMMRIEFKWFADKTIPTILAYYIAGNWIAQWKKDIMVWENKIYSNKPALVKGDGPIMKLRRWYQQFYSPNSIPIRKTNEWDW